MGLPYRGKEKSSTSGKETRRELFSGYDLLKPGVTFKLEQEAQPRLGKETPNESPPAIPSVATYDQLGKSGWTFMAHQKRGVELGKTFNLRSHHMSKLIRNYGSFSERRPERFNRCQNVLVSSDPEEMPAGSTFGDFEVPGNPSMFHHLSKNHEVQTG